MEGLKTEFRSLRQQVFQQSDGDCTPDAFSNPGIMQDMRERSAIELSSESNCFMYRDVRDEWDSMVMDKEQYFSKCQLQVINCWKKVGMSFAI